MKRFTLRKIYLASLSLACVSILISVLGVSQSLNYGINQVVNSDTETIFLSIQTDQLSLVHVAAAFPSILAIVNIALFACLCIVDEESRKLAWYSVFWILLSILYTVMNTASATGFAIMDLVYYPVMILTWLAKVMTIRVLWLNMKSMKGK